MLAAPASMHSCAASAQTPAPQTSVAQASGSQPFQSATQLGPGRDAPAKPTPLDPETLRPPTPGTPLWGIGGSPVRPGYALLPQDEDWSFLAAPSRRSDTYDPLRYVPLDADERWVLRLGAMAYAEYEYFDSPAWTPTKDGYINTRLNLYAGLSIDDRFRVMGALKHGGRYEDTPPTSPAEADDVDLHLAFAEVALGDLVGGDTKDLLLRAGRMELHYGDGRLLSMRQGPNVRRDYDGFLARYRRGKLIADAFLVYDIEDGPDAFDNSRRDASQVWGVYASQGVRGGLNRNGAVDAYYFGYDREAEPFVSGVFDETRHSVGIRYATHGRTEGRFNLDAEATYQWGDADSTLGPAPAAAPSLDIEAWAVSGTVSYGLDGSWNPVVALSAGYTSGDDDPLDGDLGTFRAVDPPGKYFGETNPLGPGNLTGATATVALTPLPKLSVTPGLYAFWRVEDADGIYTPGNTVLRGAQGGDNFLGWEANVIASYPLDDNWIVGGELAYFSVDDFLRANPPAEDITRFKIAIDYRF